MKSDIDWENDKNRIEAPRILIVDDEPLILSESLEILLTKKGCRVSVVGIGAGRSAPSARKSAGRNPAPDIGLPGFGRLRNLPPASNPSPRCNMFPCLLITALNDIFSKVKGLDAGADDFISKPFNEAELRARVWAHLRNKRLHDQPRVRASAGWKELEANERSVDLYDHARRVRRR